jgi:hypothetical protein
METWTSRRRDMETRTWRLGHTHRDIKRKTEAQAIVVNSFTVLFAQRANGSLSFVRLMTKKQMKLSICKRTKQACPAMGLTSGQRLGVDSSVQHE